MKNRKHIIFLCHGNICRSPMAEFIMKDMLVRTGRESSFDISSAAVSDEEWGNPVYPPARRELARHGISSSGHSAHKISPEEFDAADLVIVMDRSNLRLLAHIVGHEKVNDTVKVRMLMEFAEGHPVSSKDAPDVADPWYTGNFEITYRDIVSGCSGLLKYLTRN